MKGGHELNFHIQPESSIEQLLQTLTWPFSVNIDSRDHEDIGWFDSFDWRLFNAKQVLQQQGTIWSLHDGLFGAQLASATVRRQVHFPEDLEPGLLRTQLADLLELRALYYQCSAAHESCHGAFLNDDEKIVVRFSWHRLTFATPDDLDQAPLQTAWISLQSLRGYEDQQQHLVNLVRDTGLSQGEPLTMDTCWRHAGFNPGDYQSKPRTPMTADMSVNKAVSTLMSQMKGVVEANLEGIKADTDSEFLHDYRVALRRCRSLLKQLKGLYVPEFGKPLNQALRTLAKETNHMRDLDVHLLAETPTRALLPTDLAAQLSPFYTYLRQTRRRARRTMLAFLDSQEFREAMDQWQQACQPDPEQIGPKGHKSVKKWIDRKLLKTYNTVITEGSAIHDDTPDQAVHDLRIRCKQLRYLLECFATLYPRTTWKSFVKMLKGLQNILGHFNDLYVQQGVIQDYAHQHPGKSSFALGMLTGTLAAEQRATRRAFQEGFDNFANTDTRALLDSLIASGEVP